MSKALDKAEHRAQEQAARALSAFHFAAGTLEDAAEAHTELAAQASELANQYGEQAAFNAEAAEANRTRAARIREIFG